MNPWLQAALSLGVGLFTAGGALLGVRLTVRGNDRATGQRDIAARREEWWRRFTWAAEMAGDESEAKRATGLQVMAKLADSELAGEDEYRLLDAFHERVLNQLEDEGFGGERRSAS